MKRCLSNPLLLVLSILMVFWLPLGLALRAADDAAAEALPPNLGHSLRQLVAWQRAQPGNLSTPERRARLTNSLSARAHRVQTNLDVTRAVVDVTLDSSAPLATVRQGLTDLGAEVFAQYEAGHAGSVLSVQLPLDQSVEAARLPGVQSLSLVHRAWRHVGKVTSQGATVLKADKVNAMGLDGTGITVGVISDSLNNTKDEVGNPFTTTTYQDVINGDLPGPANPFGHLLPVMDLGDAGSTDVYHNDEGRAMCQIIHDLAPGAQLFFHTAGSTPETLAAAIASLRSQAADVSNYEGANCDVIVDDYGFPDEPMFSDGVVALEAKEVATSILLPGKPAVYVSAAGNEGDVAYQADFTPVSDTDARAGSGVGNLKLEQVPAQLTAGGFHNFNPKAGKVTVGQKVKLRDDSEISFQWDDPFIPGSVTTDYNLLIFDAQGNYLPDLSGIDDNLALGKALEVLDLPLGDGNDSITYQFAITRTAAGTGAAKHLRYVMNGGNPTIKFSSYNRATTFGHNAGPNVIGVAAYAYNKLAEPEAYSSMGPATVYFDAQGNRLATPEVRQQPAVAAVDGVNTSFFPPGPLTLDDGSPNTDTDGDGYPNFFGTSAAAPHVAAVAALLLQAAGGPGSLTPAQVLALLQSTAAKHDLDPNFSSATLSPGDGSTVTLSATADESDAASEDKNGFHLAFDGPAGQYLRKVVIDLESTGLKFDPSSDQGFAFTTGTKVGLKPTDVVGTLDAENTTLTLNFVPGAFTGGRSLNFGVDRDLDNSGTDGNSADLLAGTGVKVRTKGVAGIGKAQSALANQFGTGYSPAVGFGLVNAAAAIKSLRANPPVKATPRLTSGDILLTSSDNHLAEIRPDGTQVQLFPPVPDPTNGTVDAVYQKYDVSVVDGSGNIDMLYNAFTTYLITLNPSTGAITGRVAPGWGTVSDGMSSGPVAIVPVGRYLITNFSDQDPVGPPATLLRSDIDSGELRPFGQRPDGTARPYGSLSIGPDGLLYALNNEYYSTPIAVDVYDPSTLAFVRTVNLMFQGTSRSSLTLGRFAVGPGGEFYALSSDPYDDLSVYKFDATGQQVSTLALPIGARGNRNFNSIAVNPQGTVVIGALDPVLIDPAFTTTTVLSAFGVFKYTYPPTVTATFIP